MTVTGIAFEKSDEVWGQVFSRFVRAQGIRRDPRRIRHIRYNVIAPVIVLLVFQRFFMQDRIVTGTEK